MHSEEQHRTSKHRTLWSILPKKKTCSGCNSGINLVAVLEYTFLQLSSNAEQIS